MYFTCNIMLKISSKLKAWHVARAHAKETQSIHENASLNSRISNAIMDSSLLKKVSRSGKNIPRFEPFAQILKKNIHSFIFFVCY